MSNVYCCNLMSDHQQKFVVSLDKGGSARQHVEVKF